MYVACVLVMQVVIAYTLFGGTYTTTIDYRLKHKTFVSDASRIPLLPALLFAFNKISVTLPFFAFFACVVDEGTRRGRGDFVLEALSSVSHYRA